MKIKVSEATPRQLDFLVAVLEGEAYRAKTEFDGIGGEHPPHQYTADWSQAGPIMVREKIMPQWSEFWEMWEAPDKRNARMAFLDLDPLTVAMRCYVSYKLGNEAHVPDGMQ